MAMVPRLIISQSGGNPVFKMSKAGVDVLSAGNADLLFDIAFGAAQSKGFLGQYVKGSVAVNVTPAATSMSRTVNFAKTFATPPVCFAWIENNVGENFSPFFFWNHIIGSPNPAIYQIRRQSFAFTVSTTQLVMTFVNYQEDNPTGSSVITTPLVSGDYVLRYIVCQR